MRNVVLCGAARTAIGSFGGALAGVSAAELGSIAAKAAMERARLTPEQIDEVIVGNVLAAGLGQNVARQVSLKAGIPIETPAMSLNKVCGSGLRAVALAAQIIKAGDADIILAGGTENMSQSPYLAQGQRFGVKMGHQTLTDSMIRDGLWDVFNDVHMGVTAENIANQYSVTREAQDAFAAESQRRAGESVKTGSFRDEIAPVIIPQRKGEPIVFDTDEYPRPGTTAETLSKLRPAFAKEGTVTAGNASGCNDGAAMLIVASEDKAKALGLPILAVIKGYASAGVDPAIMGMGVVPASRKALQKAGLTVGDLDLIEANEAFAAQALAVTHELGLSGDKVNVNGGAIALGHPIGASGARILVTLLYEMQKRDVRYGLATLCIGGGMGTALIAERR